MSKINWFRISDGYSIISQDFKTKKEAVAYLASSTIDGKPARNCGYFIEKNTYDNGWVGVKA
jgi:hypothetical protein